MWRLIEKEPSPVLLQTLSEVLTWCSQKHFRSPELDPSPILNIPHWSHNSESIETWIERRRDCYRRAVPWINEKRSELLRTANTDIFEAPEALTKGRLLIYEPFETVDDGAAEASSAGFYDLHDAPPWDTWFLLADNAVFCCVPESAVSRAQSGISANPVDCIHWADWSRLGRIGN